MAKAPAKKKKKEVVLTPAEKFQQCRFAGSVASDDADPVALFHLERDVVQCPELLQLHLFPIRTQRMAQTLVQTPSGGHHAFAECLVTDYSAIPVVPDRVVFGKMFYGYDLHK